MKTPDARTDDNQKLAAWISDFLENAATVNANMEGRWIEPLKHHQPYKQDGWLPRGLEPRRLLNLAQMLEVFATEYVAIGSSIQSIKDTFGVDVALEGPVPEPDGGEVIAKRKGVPATEGLKEARSKRTSRCTRTGSEAYGAGQVGN